jgi:signal transduction histidine kinase
MGLKIMRYRAIKAGAKLSVRNAAPGTIVACSLEIRDGRNG